MLIREELPDDHAVVAELHRVAFEEEGSSVAALVEDLRSSLADEPGLSLVAVDDDTVIGSVLFTRSLLDAPSRLVDVQVLSPISVRPDRQRRGVGSALVRNGLQALAARDVPLVFLEGSPAYYSRLGFRPGGEHGFRRPSLRIPPAGFQVHLLPAYEPWMTGTLVYRQAFWDHDLVGLRESS